MVLATVNAVHVRKCGCRTKISLKDGMFQMNGDTYPTVNGQIGTLRTSFIWNITPGGTEWVIRLVSERGCRDCMQKTLKRSAAEWHC